MKFPTYTHGYFMLYMAGLGEVHKYKFQPKYTKRIGKTHTFCYRRWMSFKSLCVLEKSWVKIYANYLCIKSKKLVELSVQLETDCFNDHSLSMKRFISIKKIKAKKVIETETSKLIVGFPRLALAPPINVVGESNPERILSSQFHQINIEKQLVHILLK